MNKISILARSVQGVFRLVLFARFSSRLYRYVFCYFPFKRILNTRAVYLRLNPTCMCFIVHPVSSFKELCTVYLSC
jgi:hypothetical protein